MQNWKEIIAAIQVHRYDLFQRDPGMSTRYPNLDLQIEYNSYTSKIRPTFLNGFGDIMKIKVYFDHLLSGLWMDRS
jgi:hypothetical protein